MGPFFAGGDSVFTKEELDEIKKAINIVDFIGRYVNLQKAGSSYRGLCPFHNDNDPSFYVHPQRGFYHCFGCGEKGDLISFYQKIESISFSEAIRRLADLAGVQIKIDNGESEYDRYTSVLTRLSGLYSCELFESRNSSILEYLVNERKISESTIREFQLGYSPNNGTFGTFLASKLSVDEKTMIDMGIAYRRGGSLKDRFEGRLIVPISNESGRIVGFGGRLTSGGQGSKYINSPETRYFQKNRLLFNLSRARGVIKELDYAVIVEGYFDVMALYQAGVVNVVGLLGTALTEGHLRILGNYTKNLLFFLDSDSAGQSASLRSIDIAEKMDFSTAVAMVKGAKDPAELFALKGSQGISDALSMSIPGSIFRVEFYSRKLDLSLSQAKKHLIEYLKPYIEAFGSSGNFSAREMTLRALSEKTGFSEDELVRFTRKESRELDQLDQKTPINLRNKDILRVYLQYPILRSRAARQLELLEQRKEFRELLRGMKKGLELEELLDLVDVELGRELIELASSCIDESTALKILDSTGEYTNKRLVEEQIAEIDRRLSTLEDEEAKAALLIRRIELRRLLVKRKRGGD